MGSGVSAEDVLRIIREHPEAIVDALSRRPDLLRSLLAQVVGLENLLTKDDLRMLMEFLEKRFEALVKRIGELQQYTDKRFEALIGYMDKRFEDTNRRLEEMLGYMDRSFEDLYRYVDRRAGLLEKLVLAFNIPLLVGVAVLVIRLLVGGW